MPTLGPLWRVFPWDVGADDGEPYSASYITPEQTSGRYDLHGHPLILNLAESPAHAIAEQIQHRHGQRLRAQDLAEAGRPLAVVKVTVRIPSPRSVANLCEPRELHRLACRPDQLLSRDLKRSQRGSRRLHKTGLHGFRVWSALTGDWHCTVLFMDRVSRWPSLAFGKPSRITRTSRYLAEAAKVLDILLV